MAPFKPDDALEGQRQPVLRRLAWFAGLWLGSVLALATVAYGLRMLLKINS